MPITILDTSNTSSVTIRQHAIKTNEVIAETNTLSANVSTILVQKANTSMLSSKANTSMLALKANTTMLASKANTIHSHTYGSLTSKPTTMTGFGVTSIDLGTNPNTLVANSSLVRVKSSTTNTSISSSLITLNNSTKTTSITPGSTTTGNTTVKVYKDSTKIAVIAPTSNVSITSTGITMANSSVSFTMVKPTAAEVTAANYFLGSNGVWQTVGGVAPTIQVFTSVGPNTWTKPAGLKGIKVTVLGGGGAASPGTNAPGSGAGGMAIKVIPEASLPGPVTVTVGAGGPVTAPGVGGNSSFGPTIVGNGGSSGGTGSGAGGTASGGDINITGESGSVSNQASNSGHFAFGIRGKGGSTMLGEGGISSTDMSSNPAPSPNPIILGAVAGTGYGAGASGRAGNLGTATGQQGIVIVEEFY